MTLAELLATLPAGTKVSTTADFRKSTKQSLRNGDIARAIDLVNQVGYGDKPAERNGRFIAVYSGGAWFPWDAFEVNS